jgi:hypothetical protein
MTARRLAFLALLLALPAAAQPPAYTEHQLQARANFRGAFNLPDGAFFANVTPKINDAGVVAFDLDVVPGGDADALWVGGDGQGQIVYTSPAGSLLSGVDVNADGVVVFEQIFSAQDGLWIFDPQVGSAAFETSQPLGASFWTASEIDSMGRIGYRAAFGPDHAWVSYDGTATPAVHAVEAALDPGSPFSFLFTPSFDGQRRIAGKARYGPAGQVGEERPDRIVRVESDGDVTILAEDADADVLSPYSSFDNSVGVTSDGRVAFVATLVAGGRGVFLTDGVDTTTIATDADPEISEIEFFAPAVDDAGLVVFRAFDGTGLRAVFAGDGRGLVSVIREHDLVETDLGTARIDQHDASPVFGGGPWINAHGDVAFAAGLTPPDDNQIEWGSGIFVARAGGIFDDGFESGDTSAWDVTTM